MTEENPMNEVCTCTHRQAAHLGTIFHGPCSNARCSCAKYTFKTFCNPWGKPTHDALNRNEFKKIKKENSRLTNRLRRQTHV